MRKFIRQQVAGFGHTALAVDVDDCSEPTRFSRSRRRSNGSREHPAIIAICKFQAPFVFEGFPALQRCPKGIDRSFPIFGVNGSLPVIQTLRLGKTSQFIPLHIDVIEITRCISRPSNPGNAVDHPLETAFPLVDSFLCRIAQALLGYAPHRSLRQNRQRVLLKLGQPVFVRLAIDEAKSAQGRAFGRDQRLAGVKADMRLTRDERIVRKANVFLRVANDHRFRAQHGMRAETGRARRFARFYSRSSEEHLTALFDHGDHDHGYIANLRCKIDDLLQFGIVDHGVRTVRSKDREAPFLVAIGFRRGFAFGPKDVFLTVHALVQRRFRLKFKRIPNAKSKFAASVCRAVQSVCSAALARLSALTTVTFASP